MPLHLWALATPLLHNRIEPEVVHAVGATAGGDDPAAVHVNPLDVDPSFSEVAVGFRLDGFAGHNERHYDRISVFVVLTETVAGTNERTGIATNVTGCCDSRSSAVLRIACSDEVASTFLT